ncbi:hypothetical protein PC116_g29261 [Phytophthora cactorum]|nr:hypothetical protein PC116_g29261 [Phytophthora cactorum]
MDNMDAIMEHVPHDFDANVYGNPQNFSEHYRAVNALWAHYREEGGAYEGGFRNYRVDREEWAEAPFPRPGEINPRDWVIKQNWKRTPYKYDTWESTWPPFMLNTSDLWDQQYRNEIRQRCRDAVTFFESRQPGNVMFLKVLGYGGNGIALKFARLNPPKEMVIKIGRKGWFSHEIRREERMLKMINRADVFQVDNRPFEYDLIDQFDSSDDDDDFRSLPDSEHEIPDENRIYRGWNDTRRYAFENDPEDVEAKFQQHQERLREQDEKIDREVRNFVGHDQDNPLIRHDFIILEYLSNGDLGSLIQRIEKANMPKRQKRVPNRVLWSFWFCCTLTLLCLLCPPPPICRD